ncbi:MAG TPA: translation initiation factor IF-2, partial [Bryobacteraceae bacterium]|nr:translation initiation factor IF-2 [Bryobacteraceae bacterium]
MSKIRINELARQLEVKSREVIDKLHELGITEALTHSSSIDDENAEKLRRYFGGDTSVLEAAKPPKPAETPETPAPAKAKPAAETKPLEPPKRGVPIAPPMRPPAAAAPAEPEAKATSPAAPPAEQKKQEAPAEDKPRAIPLRPPMLGRGAPIHPPVGPRSAAPASAAPAAHPPAAPLTPPGPLRPLSPPTRPIPSGGTRPGQILSGPRQPLPSAAPAPPPRPQAPTPATPSAPSTPTPPPQAVRPGVPIAPPPRPTAAPGQPRPSAPPPRPAAGQPIAGQPLAGQPAARPVVPPRADLAARLGARPAPPAPGAPPPPRPGVPLRPSSPRPGQPLYQGPPRPGQPSFQARGARPGMPGPGGRPGGPRPMHPTSRGGALLGPGAPPPPDHAARRAPGGNKKPGGRGPRDRNREAEEKILRPQSRREQAAPPPINRDITISEGITVKELSEKLDVKANLVIKKLVDRGIFATINQTLDSKMATELAREFGASTSSVSYEEEAMLDIELAEEASDRFLRPPVVTIMGHVDHGKTSLLDAIRTANVADREAGGITQHIGAYHVDHNGKTIVFIDTPGHEAFTRMRARGAKVTDIVVLVVAADDGVMPQTLEAIDHARAAKVPIIVAINKIDKPEAQPDRIKQQLADRGLNPEEWGGDTVMVPVSARQKTNLDLLLEMILLVSEIADLRANPARPGMASVLEAKLDRGRGPVATILVRNGTVRVGDDFI